MSGNRMDGTFHGPVVQAGAIHGDVHFHAAKPPRPRTPPPAGWTELPELPSEVRYLLRAQIQTAQELPYRLPGARRPSLATVYVRQGLGTGTEKTSEQTRPEPILDSRGQLIDSPNPPVARLAVRPPSRTVREALDGDNHLLVTGGPGQGKSTLSLRLAADVAMRWTGTGPEPLAEPVVPLRLTARELASRLALPFPEAVAQSVHVEYGARLAEPVEPAVLRERIAGCRWLMLVDGLDEVADSALRDKLVSILASWASDDDSPYRIVLTTRPIEGAALAPLQRVGAARYELQPFDQEALRHFACNWFESSDLGERFVRQIRAAHLDELVRVPLLATIAAIIFEQYDDRPLPDNQYSLYEAYLKYLRSAHTTELKRFDHACGALLEHLGVVRLEADTSLVAATLDWAARHLPDSPGEDVVAYLAAVGPVTRRGDDLRFLHHSFAEHLAATAKARLLPDSFTPEHPEFARLLHAARPDGRGRYARAVLLHYARLHATQADTLLRWLHGSHADDHLLAARLLAWHIPASTEVVDAFLAKARAWAKTSQHPALRILQRSSRAAHHPGITDWLAEIMRDAESPWESRVEAATALATRLHGDESAEAVVHLRLVVDDESIVIRHRLAAAEALSDCGGERETAERGLRAILADPAASARQCRNAALVLANFDGAARTHAVESLVALLDDPMTPDDDLVEAANGLVEIGVEFHGRCADVFRSVIAGIPHSLPARDAALGLASLGADQLVEAAGALCDVVTDRRTEPTNRCRAARTLAKLGPQYRKIAADLVRAMTVEFALRPGDKPDLAEALAELGMRPQAVGVLREVVADPFATTNNRYWAAQAFADLGSEYRAETATVLLGLVRDGRSASFEKTGALGKLAEFGPPYRDSAVAALRELLADLSELPDLRCEAGTQLNRLGPEFHGEVADHLRSIASTAPDPGIRAQAWFALRNTGVAFSREASRQLFALLGPDVAVAWQEHDNRPSVLAGDDDRDSVAEVLAAVVRDTGRKGAFRVGTAFRLLQLGRRHHQTVVAVVVGLLRSPDLPVRDLPSVVGMMTKLSGASRAELAAVIRATDTTAAEVCHVADAVLRLGCPVDPEIVDALRSVVTDDATDVSPRLEAAVTLARAHPPELGMVTDLVLGSHHHGEGYAWGMRVAELARLGADVLPRLRLLMSAQGVRRVVQEEAACLLARNQPDARSEALAQLRAQAADEYLDFYWRTDAVTDLAEFDPDAFEQSVVFHRAVLEDERQPIRERCVAASQLVHLDESSRAMAMAMLRHFVASTEFTGEERACGVNWWPQFGRSGQIEPEALALLTHPETPDRTRVDLHSRLRGKPSMTMKRSLLADSTLPAKDRVGGITAWANPWLADEAEAVVREALAAPETSAAERADAAVALARLSPRHIPAALRLLAEMSEGADYALRELCDLSLSARRRVADEAMTAARNGSWRQRVNAVGQLLYLMPGLAESVVDVLRAVLDDSRTADCLKVEIHFALCEHDGLEPVRAMRDDPRAPAPIRWLAADKLRDYDIADRAAGAHVLHGIATSGCRSALRWRAARDLLRFGERGRELAAPVLRAMVADEDLPTLARVAAAATLAKARPDLRLQLLRQLRRLRTAENPLVRIQVLKTIGGVDTSEAARSLAAMTKERNLRQGVRLRAATTMAELRRDYREKAAIVAREVAHDESVPWHVRVKAARSLARWSELCRGEAREVLRALTTHR
ncbi:hypothetical protein AOZ06_36195 [Kibdelosporangium phytohabitans]|uniref:NACHT domain-containing protein n=1 Tax=Kibdelosporangium phytohabitans TaxID=860235 RepID=A0A0N9IA54_9PSEU|nr:hypothetical protein AOZ06_36195 [Kibdelosporangium phytohabitans]